MRKSAIILGMTIAALAFASIFSARNPDIYAYGTVSPQLREGSPRLARLAAEARKGEIRGADAVERLSAEEMTLLLDRNLIGCLDADAARATGALLPGRMLRKGASPRDVVESVIPSEAGIIAMLARDRDVDDFLENADDEGQSGKSYGYIASLSSRMKPLRETYEAFFDGLFEGMTEAGLRLSPAAGSAEAAAYKSGVTLPRMSSRPPERDYKYSHTYALDIFLKDVRILGPSGLEKGPMLFSLAEGIVVAANSSWRGGEKDEDYRSGGITPKAGNGVIVYSPSAGKYYLYFHMYDILAEKGAVIPKGYPLGHGGNTGTNARKPGHGEHLHLEIYDARTARFLKNREIADIVF